MRTVSASFSNVDGTETAVGWSGSHSVLAARPKGVAGGTGQGMNGAQMLALAIGACFCNDLHYVAHRRGTAITALKVTVDLHLDGEPLLAVEADVHVSCGLADGCDSAEIIDEARQISTVGNSLSRGMVVRVLP